jgi:hypothetical protein
MNEMNWWKWNQFYVLTGIYTISRKNPELVGILCSHVQSQVREHMSKDLKTLTLKNVLQCNENGDIVILVIMLIQVKVSIYNLITY